MNLLFVHGAGCTGSVFEAQIEALGGVAVTLPGRCGAPGAPSTIDAFADAVGRELALLGWTDAVICGHSMGGAIALELGLRGTLGVRGIVVIGSGAKLRVAPAIFERLERDFITESRALAGAFFAEPTPERIDAVAELMLQVGPQQTIRDFRACDVFNASERLADLQVPLLAIVGRDDVLTPPKFARFLEDRVPRGAARILEGAGHFAMVERPEETNALVGAFVASIQSG
jgi:pimeloyl-ACP methyl ester carboxylesterase